MNSPCEFIVDGKSLGDAVSDIIKIIDKKGYGLTASDVKIECNESGLTLTGRDLERECSVKIGCECLSLGEFCINAEKLKDIASSGDRIHFNRPPDNKTVLIKNKQSTHKIHVREASDFRIKNKSEFVTHSAAVSSSDFVRSINSVAFSASKKDVRHYLMSVSFYFCEELIDITATDGHRLSHSVIKTNLKGIDKEILIPKESILPIVSLFGGNNEELVISFNENIFSIESHKKTFTTNLVYGKFPNWRNFDRAQNSFISFERESIIRLIESVKVSAPVSDGKGFIVHLTLENDSIRFQSKNSGDTAESERLSCTTRSKSFGEMIQAKMNGQYLIEALKSFDDKLISISFDENKTQMKIFSENPGYCLIGAIK